MQIPASFDFGGHDRGKPFLILLQEDTIIQVKLFGDIEIYEDGIRQGAVSFDMFEVTDTATHIVIESEAPARPPAPSRISTNTEEEDVRGRTFVIFFDDAHLTPYTAHRAKAAVAEFLKTEISEGDRVTLVAPGAGKWWTTRMRAGLDELLESARAARKGDTGVYAFEHATFPLGHVVDDAQLVDS